MKGVRQTVAPLSDLSSLCTMISAQWGKHASPIGKSLSKVQQPGRAQKGSQMKYFFFKTRKEGSRERLNPLPGQTLSDGTPVETGLNAQTAAGGKEIRAAYPIGTVFCSRMCDIAASSGAPYYCVGSIYPVVDPENAISSLPVASEQMRQAYEEYRAGVKAEAAEAAGAVEPAPAPKKRSLLERIMGDHTYDVPTVEKDGFFVASDDWYLLVRNILQKANTMLIGPSGTGKTQLVMLVADKLGLPCHVYDMGAMLDPVSSLLGVHRLVAGGSEFDYSKFVEEIQKPGVILLDELSRAPLSCHNILFPCLDSRRMLPVEIAGAEDIRAVEVHPDCVFIATANIGAEYTGTQMLDRALMGRFMPLELDYMGESDEAAVLSKRCGISADDAIQVIKVARTVRSLHGKGELGCTVSTRETLAAGYMIADGWSVMAGLERCFLPLFEGTKTEGERSVVYNTIIKH